MSKALFEQLSKHLENRNVDLVSYQKYLSQLGYQPAEKGKTTLSLSEREAVRFLGAQLIQAQKVSLSEFNQILEETEGKANTRDILQQFVRQRKLDIDEFLRWEQGVEQQEEKFPEYLLEEKKGKLQLVLQVSHSQEFFEVGGGQYQILKKISNHSYGTLYKAFHPLLQQNVALKMFFKEGEEENHEASKRFYREVAATAKLKHPNIVQIKDSGYREDSSSKQFYCIMEWIEGENLAQWFQEEQPSLKESLKFFIKCLEALEYAHSKNIIHRDLKPINIFVGEKQEPKIVDFGLARDLDHQTQFFTKKGMILGTPIYMAPEQILGESSLIGPCSDIYAMGVCLYEVFAQKLPFKEKASSTELYYKILQEVPPPPSFYQPNIPKKLDKVILKALEKSPRARYESAATFAEALRKIIEPRPSSIHSKKKQRLPTWFGLSFPHSFFDRIFYILFLLILGGGLGVKLYFEKQHLEKANKAYQKSYQEYKKISKTSSNKIQKIKPFFELCEHVGPLLELEPSVALQAKRLVFLEEFLGFLENSSLSHPTSKPSKEFFTEPQKNVKKHYEKGVYFLEKKSWKKAMIEFERVIRLSPKWSKVYVQRGRVQQGKGNFVGALMDFQHALQLNPQEAKAYFYRASLRYQQQDIESALADYRQAIKMDPFQAEFYQKKGGCYATQGEFQKALESYNKALSLEKKSFSIYYDRANLYFQWGKHQLAKKDYLKALKILDKKVILESETLYQKILQKIEELEDH